MRRGDNIYRSAHLEKGDVGLKLKNQNATYDLLYMKISSENCLGKFMN